MQPAEQRPRYKGLAHSAKRAKPYQASIEIKESERPMLPPHLAKLTALTGGYYVDARDAARAADKILYKLGRATNLLLSQPELDVVDATSWTDLMASFRAMDNSPNGTCFSKGSSTYRGVCWDKARKKWKAQIRMEGCGSANLGNFDSEQAAARVYDQVAAYLKGSSAKLNFTDKVPPDAPDASIILKLEAQRHRGSLKQAAGKGSKDKAPKGRAGNKRGQRQQESGEEVDEEEEEVGEATAAREDKGRAAGRRRQQQRGSAAEEEAEEQEEGPSNGRGSEEQHGAQREQPAKRRRRSSFRGSKEGTSPSGGQQQEDRGMASMEAAGWQLEQGPTEQGWWGGMGMEEVAAGLQMAGVAGGDIGGEDDEWAAALTLQGLLQHRQQRGGHDGRLQQRQQHGGYEMQGQQQHRRQHERGQEQQQQQQQQQHEGQEHGCHQQQGHVDGEYQQQGQHQKQREDQVVTVHASARQYEQFIQQQQQQYMMQYQQMMAMLAVGGGAGFGSLLPPLQLRQAAAHVAGETVAPLGQAQQRLACMLA